MEEDCSSFYSLGCSSQAAVGTANLGVANKQLARAKAVGATGAHGAGALGELNEPHCDGGWAQSCHLLAQSFGYCLQTGVPLSSLSARDAPVGYKKEVKYVKDAFSILKERGSASPVPSLVPWQNVLPEPQAGCET